MHSQLPLFSRHDFQFFNQRRLTELYEKEVRYLVVGNINLLVNYCMDMVWQWHSLIVTNFQQKNQKSKMKDSIDVDEPEGQWVFPRLFISFFLFILFFVTMVPYVVCTEVDDPLTAEEVEERERLLEEVSVFSQRTEFQH